MTATAAPDSPSSGPRGPLAGIRILDLSRLLPGPLAGLLMADMGADVIKIERPDKPDYVRFYPPHIGNLSAYYLALNRSKRSLGLDLSRPEGRAVFLDLVAGADIVLESFRPGVLDEHGLGYEAVSAAQPHIIYVSLTGYGQSGPHARRAGHDLNYVAEAGLVDLTGPADGSPSTPGVQIADVAGGAYAAVIGALSALHARERAREPGTKGQGQHVDVAMTDAVTPFLTLQAAARWAGSPLSGRGTDPLSGALANYGIYRCADGRHVALGALEPKFWERFCRAVEREDWIGRMAPDPAGNRALRQDLEALFATRERGDWVALGERADCCLGPVLELDELDRDENLQARGLFVEQVLGDGTRVRGFAPPIKFSGTPARVGAAAPALGADNHTVLRELGYEQKRIESLEAEGILGTEQD